MVGCQIVYHRLGLRSISDHRLQSLQPRLRLVVHLMGQLQGFLGQKL